VPHQAQIDHHHPSTKSKAAAPWTKKIGPIFSRVKAKKAAYIASMTKSPWAKLTTLIIPQINLTPDENST
jgi:hypothetical protein